MDEQDFPVRHVPFDKLHAVSVEELRNYLNSIPAFDRYGDPFEVWIETNWCTSNAIKGFVPLNKREDGHDVLLVYKDFK